jgi:hypothetical protein
MCEPIPFPERIGGGGLFCLGVSAEYPAFVAFLSLRTSQDSTAKG